MSYFGVVGIVVVLVGGGVAFGLCLVFGVACVADVAVCIAGVVREPIHTNGNTF